ncbi:MAG: tetratricopeptide repeat protein [Pirellulales bacterium]|nr:tetratricopeptide repeat protein [Pirellulales bacterium]
MKTQQLSIFLLLTLSPVGLITGCSQQAQLDEHLIRGNESFEKGDYQTAEIEYKNVLQIDSSITEAIGNIGLIYYRQGRLIEAYPFLTQARTLEPDNLIYRSKLCSLLQQAGSPQEAWDEASFVLEKDPTDKTALFTLQTAGLFLQKIGGARTKIEQLNAAKPSAAAVLALGMLDAIESNFDAADVKFQKAVAMDPNLGEAHAAIATLHLARNEIDAANASYKKSFDLSEGEPSKQFIYAQFKYRTGDKEAANKLIEKILENEPRFVPALTLKAQLISADANFEDATKLADEILRLTPYNPEAILLSSRLKLAQNKFDEAILQLERANERFPESDALAYGLALAHLGNNDPTKAAANLTRTIAINPNHNEAILMQAALNARQGDPEAAIISLEEVLIKNSQNVQAQTLLAQIHLEAGQLDEALNLYQALGNQLEANPNPPQLEAEVLLRMGKTDEARAALARSLSRDPNYLLSLERITDIDIAGRRFDEAVSRIDSMFQNSTNQAYLHMLKGKTLIAGKDNAAGEIELKRAIELKPTLRDAYLYLAVHYTITGKNAQALDKLQAMVDLNAKDIEALMRIGGIHEQQKDYESARSTYMEVVAVDSNNFSALNNLAYINAEHFDNIYEAYDQAMKARDLRPTDPAIADTLGWINYKRGDYLLALSLIKESAAKISQHPEIQYHLGKVNAALNNDAEAEAAFSKALEFGLEADQASESRQFLQGL